MAEKLNIVEKANKVITFRKYIREECRKKGLEYPSDNKIAEYISQGYGMDVNDFMADYIEKEGIFRDPINDFIKEVEDIQWGNNKPTEDEIKAFVAENGYNMKRFIREQTIKSYDGLERATLLSTLNLSPSKLVNLWNKFIEESAMYGEDSYIYDLANAEDIAFLNKNMGIDEKKEVNWQRKNNNVRYVQWLAHNGDAINTKTDEDIKNAIVAYWSDIFERIMLYPTIYDQVTWKDGVTTYWYFSDIFWPCVRELCGFSVNKSDGKLKQSEKK